LFITSKRLLFLGRKGFFNKETRVIHTLALAEITELDLHGRIRKRLHLVTENDELKMGGPSKVLESIPAAINLATSFSEHSLVTTSGSLRILNLKVDVTSLRDELDQLINYAISPETGDQPRQSDIPHPHQYPEGHYPRFSPRSDGLERDPVFQLEQQRFSIESTMELLKKQFEEGKLSDEKFFKQYRSLTQELYLVEAQIRDIRSRRGFDDTR
jgi:hypothetical protein